jgi:hypothetical protein
MKCLKFAAAIALCLAMGQTFAQTCGSPTALTHAGVSNVDGCAQTNTVSLLCSFQNNPSPDTIFSFTLGASHTATQITVTTTTAGFQPNLVVQSACGSTDECLGQASAAAAGGSASLVFSTQTPAIGPGAYFLVVDGTSQASAADCGTFSLAVDGTLPVQLQKFSVD